MPRHAVAAVFATSTYVARVSATEVAVAFAVNIFLSMVVVLYEVFIV